VTVEFGSNLFYFLVQLAWRQWQNKQQVDSQHQVYHNRMFTTPSPPTTKQQQQPRVLLAVIKECACSLSHMHPKKQCLNIVNTNGHFFFRNIFTPNLAQVIFG
jgi:hypothetical protein